MTSAGEEEGEGEEEGAPAPAALLGSLSLLSRETTPGGPTSAPVDDRAANLPSVVAAAGPPSPPFSARLLRASSADARAAFEKGSVDAWVQPMLRLAWSKFTADTNSLNRWTLYLFAMALYYDPLVTARAVEALGIGNDFFSALAKLSKLAKTKDERKALSLALCGLIKRVGELGASSPATANVKQYVEVLAVQTREIAEQRFKAREAAAAGSDDEDDDEEDDDDFEDEEIDLQDLDEGESADQSAKIKLNNRLKEEIAAIRAQYGASDEEDDDDDSDYYDEDGDDECERVSPLDAFSEFVAIKETLTGLGSGVLLGWFSQADLVAWNTLLDDNIAKDIADKQQAASA